MNKDVGPRALTTRKSKRIKHEIECQSLIEIFKCKGCDRTIDVVDTIPINQVIKLPQWIGWEQRQIRGNKNWYCPSCLGTKGRDTH